MDRQQGNSESRVWGIGRTQVVLIIWLRGIGKELLREVVVEVGRGRLKVSNVVTSGIFTPYLESTPPSMGRHASWSNSLL